MENNDAEIWATSNHAENSAPERGKTANGHNKFPLNAQHLVGVQSKFRRKYYHKFVFILFLILIFVLIITIICLTIRAKYSFNVCETKECLRSASNLLQSMNSKIDPCEDFYQFTCGNWADEHPRPDSLTSYDWFSEKQAKIIRKIRTFLQSNESDNDPESVNKARIMYKACTDGEQINKIGVEPIFHYLREFKLPIIPTFIRKLQNESTSGVEEQSIDFDWIETIVYIKRALELDLLIGFDVFSNPTNRTVNMIAIGTPESGSSLPFYDKKNHNHLKKAKQKLIMEEFDDEKDENDVEYYMASALGVYLQYIKKVVTILVAKANPEIVLDDISDNITNAAVDIVRVTKHIYKLTEEAENSTKGNQNPLDDIIYLKLEELQTATDQVITNQSKSLAIQWEKFLKLMFTNITFKNNEILNLNNEKILSSKADLKYLQDLNEFITEKSSISIEFYLWWNVIEELAIHTTNELRQLHNDYTKLIIKTEGTTTRSLYCTNGINSLMGMAVSYAIIDKDFLNETKPKVDLMLTNIHKAFNSLVKSTEWMDEETKIQTLMKSGNMKSFIGFPDWIMNKTLLDDYYVDIDVNITTHLDNLIGVIKWQMKKKLMSLKRPLNKFEWATSPSNVNAFHTFQSNSITIPIAILQFPFYNLGLEALNYGAIGTILGHELTHGFDDSGRMFDKCGNMRQWWTNTTIKEYVNRTNCFIKQYENYVLPEINEHIDGELTLGENIADNGGLREAYYAYKLLIDEIGEEKLLPGLEMYSHEQLLFISFGNLWCETLTKTASKYAVEDSHCPGQIRLKGVLANSPEFSEAFKCPKGSGMYPTEERCQIW